MGANGIYGLSGSGLDVDSMVKVGMISKQNEADKMQQKITQNEWTKAEMLEFYGELQTFGNFTLSQYKMSNTMNARGATSSNAAAVSVTANSNAAPMQHYVEVGQLASAAYLIGTESVTRIGENAASNSTNLVDSLFKSLTKQGDGYIINGDSNNKVDANDVAFTFKISDGFNGDEYLESTDENIFTALAVDDSGNPLAIDSKTKINSHTVVIESAAASPKNVTSLNLGVDLETSSIKTVFQKMFNMSDEDYANRIGKLASKYPDATAFTITFDDDSDSTNSDYKAEFKYSDLTVTAANSFSSKISGALSGSNISVSFNDGQLVLSNTASGSDKRINISIDTGTGTANTFIGQDPDGDSSAADYRIDTLPQILSKSNDVLATNASAAASDVFKSLLALDEYGGTDTAAQYIEKYKDSYDIALSIQFTDTKNGGTTTGTADITFRQLASNTPFSDVIRSSLSAAGLTDLNVNVDATTGKLSITNGTYGSDSSLAFSVRNVGIGDAEHPYPTENPSTKIIPNQSISDWFDSINGGSVDRATYMKRLIELRGDPSVDTTDIALNLVFDDGLGNITTVGLSYEDLADTTANSLGTKIASVFGTTPPPDNNIKVAVEGDQIKFYNDTLGSDSKISVSVEIPSTSKLNETTLETNGKISLNVGTATSLSSFFDSVIDTEFTAGDKAAWATDNTTAFKLAFQTSDGSHSTTAINVSYKELVDTSSNGLKTLLEKAVDDTNDTSDKFQVRVEKDENNTNPKLYIVNTETGESSSIQAVISGVTMGLAEPHLAGTAATRSFTLNLNSVNSVLDDEIGSSSNKVSHSNGTETAFTMTFNDNKGSVSTENITWNQLFSGDFSSLKATHGNIKWNSSKNQFENDRLSTDDTIQISTTAGVATTTVKYNTTTGTTDISTNISTAITKTKVDTTKINKTTITPTKIALETITPTALTADSTETDGDSNTTYTYTIDDNTVTSSSPIYSYTDPTNGNVTTTTNSANIYYYTDPSNDNVVIASSDTTKYWYTDPTDNTKKVVDSDSPWYSYTDPTTNQLVCNQNGADQWYYTNPETSKVVVIGSSDSNLWSYTFNGETKTANDNSTIYSYNDPTDNQLKSGTSVVYSYNEGSGIQTDTQKHYSYVNPEDNQTKYTTTTIANVVSSTTLSITDFLSGKLGSTEKHLTNTTTANNTATNSLKNLFSTTSIGESNPFTPTNYSIENPGESTNQNNALIGNISNFLGANSITGDDGLTSDEFAKTLLNFFGGGNETIDTSGSTYSITQQGSAGVVKIDGETHELEPGQTVLIEDGIKYTFKNLENSVGKGGIAYSKNNEKEISVTYAQLANGYSFNDLVSNVNNLGLNVRATYDSVQDRFSIYNKESGAENQIRIGFEKSTNVSSSVLERSADFFNQMGLKQTGEGVTGSEFNFAVDKTSILSGQNAIVKIDGIDYNDLSKNNATINGVTYTFNAVTNNNLVSTGEKDVNGNDKMAVQSSSDVSKVTVNITQDTATIVEKVKSFVSDYNALMKKLYEWYDEKPNSDYKPLTSKQKEKMTEEQIEKWEKKAKAGLLYHNSTLGKVINDLRSAIFESVDGISNNYNNVFSIGISSTSTQGQITLDEEKLKAALAEDPDAVYNIFAKLDKGETQYLVMRGEQVWINEGEKKGDNDIYITDENGNRKTQIVGGTTQYLVAKDGEQSWVTEKTDDYTYVNGTDGKPQTKIVGGTVQYLIMKNAKRVWTTTVQAGDVNVYDSDGNPKTKTVERSSYNGIAQRLGDIFLNSMKSVASISGTSADVTEDSQLNNLLRELQTKMSNFKKMMDAFEKQLYKKYDAMESALALLGAQLNYVTSAFQS